MTTLSREQVRAIDRRAAAEFGIPTLTLMENAGRACAALMMTLNPRREPVTVYCGSGNNGGDGYVMMRHLHDAGWPVAWAGLDPVSPDAILNAQRVVHLLGQPMPLNGWIVDALYGIGISRPVDARSLKLVNAINTARRPVFAIDIPTGLDCDTGEPLGACVKATHTATFIAPKLGFLNPRSKTFTGTVHVLEIGVPQALKPT